MITICLFSASLFCYRRPYDYPPLKGKNTEQETEYSSLIPRPAHVISSLQKEENDTCFSYFKDQQTLGGSNKIMHMEIFAKMGKSTPGFPSSIQLQVTKIFNLYTQLSTFLNLKLSF